jgi:hypothetical protein
LYSAYFWISISTLGTVAKVTGDRLSESNIDFVFKLLRHDFGVSYFILAILFFRQVVKTKNFKPIALIGIMSACPIVLGTLSYNGDLRYYFASALLLGFAFVSANGQNSPVWKNLTSGIIFLLAFLQILFTFSIIEKRDILPSWINSFYTSFTPSKPNNLHKVQTAGIESLRTALPKDTKSSVCILQMRQFNGLDWSFDPWALTLAARDQNLPWEFSRPPPHEFSTTELRYTNSVIPRCDYVIILPIEWVPAPIEHFMSDVGEFLFNHYKNGTLEKEGWRWIATLPYSSEDQLEGQLLLIKNLNRR